VVFKIRLGNNSVLGNRAFWSALFYNIWAFSQRHVFAPGRFMLKRKHAILTEDSHPKHNLEAYFSRFVGIGVSFSRQNKAEKVCPGPFFEFQVTFFNQIQFWDSWGHLATTYFSFVLSRFLQFL
jgi:hypothetical protein